MRGVRKKCVTLQEVSEVIRHAHNKEGHWKQAITMKKLRKYYWPIMANNVRNYILGCMKCAQQGNAQRTQTQSPTVIDKPNVLWGMDYIGPFPKTVVTMDEALKCMWPQLHKSKGLITNQGPNPLSSISTNN